MMYESQEKKTTALVPSVGADGGRQSQNIAGESIPDDNSEINHEAENLEDMLRKMRRMTNPHYLHTISMTELYQTTYPLELTSLDSKNQTTTRNHPETQKSRGGFALQRRL